MSTASLDRLSDHFAEIVLNKIKSKSITELIAAEVSAEKFEGTKNVRFALIDAIEEDKFLDMDLFNYVEEAYENELYCLTREWSCEAHHMKCTYADLMTYFVGNCWWLSYQICIGDLELHFDCYVDKNKVEHPHISVKKGWSEDYWDYYFTHTAFSLV